MQPDGALSKLGQVGLPVEASSFRPLIVVAHPDDETLGAGGLLLEGRHSCVVHLTDGAPRDMGDATGAGFLRREDYATARRREVSSALEIAGVGAAHTVQLGAVDQESVFHAARLARAVAALVAARRPTLIVTHTYEGGHPDHDAAALVVRAAASMLMRAGGPVPPVVEFPSYHRDEASGALQVGRFLRDGSNEAVIVVRLSEDRQGKKRRMLECFHTQRRVLAMFDPEVEEYRPAIRHSFDRAPHAGTLHYETLGWSIDGESWRRQAMAALDELRLDVCGEPRL